MNRCMIASVVILGLFAMRSSGSANGRRHGGRGLRRGDRGSGREHRIRRRQLSDRRQLGGSELDAGYATISGGRLYLMLTGNLEPNFNKLEVFFDSKAGGENVLSGTPQYDYFDGSKWISQNMGGMTFDTGFTADYHLYARWGGGNPTPGQFEVDFVNRNGGADAAVPASSGKSVDSPTVNLTAIGSIPAGNMAVIQHGQCAELRL